MTSAIPHQAIYRRWRAQTFAGIVGQGAVVETLRNAVRTGRVGHAILFVGPRGTGKTSLARILAKALNCTDLRDGDPCDACPSCVSIREGTTLDLVEIDAASNNGIDNVRSLREGLAYPPGQLKRKVYILDEAHQITGPAWNALLKSIEEPPDFVVFMFASTEPSSFPPAILSRLQRFDVRRLTAGEIEGKLRRILAADEREADDAAIRLITRIAAGGMRDAEAMLDQLLSAAPDRIEEHHVRDLLGLADAETVDQFIDILVRGDAAAGVALLDSLDERGRDIQALLDQVVDTIRQELVTGLTDPSKAPHDPGRLAEAGRRIAAIDPGRAGFGGVRFQLELALFAAAAGVPPAASGTTAQAAPGSPAPSPAEPRRAPAPGSKPQAQAEPVRPKPPEVAPTPKETPAPPREAPVPAASAPATPTEAASATPNPATPAVPAEPVGDFDRLVASWAEIVAAQRPATKAVISECRPLSVDGAVVTLGFPEAKVFLKDAAARRSKELDEAVGSFLGRAVNVRCVPSNIDVPVPLQPDAAYVLAEARRIFADDIVDVGEVN